MDHLRIGFDAKRAFMNRAGLGNYSRNTLASLHKYFPQHGYVLYTPEVKTQYFKEYPLFEMVSPSNTFYRVFQSYWRNFVLSSLLERGKLDIFHGLSNELPAGIHETGIPSVVTIHDLIFLSFPAWYRPVDRKIYLHKVQYACKVAAKIVAISNHTRDDLVKYLNVDPEGIRVIYQSISERFYFHSVRDHLDEVLARYNLPSRYVLTVGTIEQRKNQLAVLKAINRKNLTVPYVIVGKSTHYTQELLEYIYNNRMTDQVYILNDVDDMDLPALYQQALCMVYLSHYEGFGLPVAEAMASGCPVITAATSSLPEIGIDAVLYCEPGDEAGLGDMIGKLLNDQKLRNALSEKGIQRARFFHPEERVNALMELYREITGK